MYCGVKIKQKEVKILLVKDLQLPNRTPCLLHVTQRLFYPSEFPVVNEEATAHCRFQNPRKPQI